MKRLAFLTRKLFQPSLHFEQRQALDPAQHLGGNSKRGGAFRGAHPLRHLVRHTRTDAYLVQKAGGLLGIVVSAFLPVLPE